MLLKLTQVLKAAKNFITHPSVLLPTAQYKGEKKKLSYNLSDLNLNNLTLSN